MVRNGNKHLRARWNGNNFEDNGIGVGMLSTEWEWNVMEKRFSGILPYA